jgi:hypothetical protein
MLRTLLAGLALCSLAALALATAGMASACADEPVNPLRRATAPAPSSEQPTGPAPSSEPASIVPKQFGQPELLPVPGSAIAAYSGSFDPTSFDPAPFDNLVHPLFAEPWFAHCDPNDPDRHIGIGQPLVGTSWRNRPWFFGTFVGGVMMDDLVPNQIYQNDTTLIGARLGFDFDHYWGLEGRWAFARPDLVDGLGAPLNPASRDNFGDVSLAVYPLGDARWRPYLSAGVGFVTFRFNDQIGQRVSEAAFEIPLGFGVKYYYGPWLTLRFDFTDNLTLGNDRVSGMHNVSLMAGAEFRFGGRRPSYFPWHNGTTYW